MLDLIGASLLEALLRSSSCRNSWQHLKERRKLLLLRSSCCVLGLSSNKAAGDGSGAATMTGRGVCFSSSVTGHHQFITSTTIFCCSTKYWFESWCKSR